MLDSLLGFGRSIWDQVHPHFEPTNPDAGSQGAARGSESDGSFLGNLGQGIGDFGRGLSQEGLAGLLDPAGMLDRQDAQRDLASRFNVLPDDSVGTREQNQVSEAEFQEISRTYSDIRRGNTDLQFGRTAGATDEAHQTFQDGAMNDIADIMQTGSGRGLIGSLAHAPLQDDGTAHRTTTINQRANAGNAEGGGMFAQSGYADYVPGADHLPTRDNLRSDVTLYHELTHAHHAVYNTWDAETVQPTLIEGFLEAAGLRTPDPDTGTGQYEHQAAGIGGHANDEFSENRYRAERRWIGAHDVGERTTGAETDDNMTHRDAYTYGGARTTPATTMPGRPTTTHSATGAGGTMPVGSAAGHHHDDDDHAH